MGPRPNTEWVGTLLRALQERDPKADAAGMARLEQKAGIAPGSMGGFKMSGAPKATAAQALDELVTLYRGGKGGSFFSTNPERAASYGPVDMVKAPRSVFEAGQANAAKLGQPTKFDTVLPDEWVRQAVPAPHIKPKVHEIAEESPDEIAKLLASLGIQ